MAKADAGVTGAMKKALNETNNYDHFDRLNYMKKMYLTHRQVSVAEATYRLDNCLHLKASSVKSTFVSTCFPENRSNMYRKVNNKEKSPHRNDEGDYHEIEKSKDIKCGTYSQGMLGSGM